jgi:hypothetical protein
MLAPIWYDHCKEDKKYSIRDFKSFTSKFIVYKNLGIPATVAIGNSARIYCLHDRQNFKILSDYYISIKPSPTECRRNS